MTRTLSGSDDYVALPVACCGDSRDDLPATSVYGESSESIIACADDVQLTRPRMFVTFLPYSITMCPVAAACSGLSATTIDAIRNEGMRTMTDTNATHINLTDTEVSFDEYDEIHSPRPEVTDLDRIIESAINRRWVHWRCRDIRPRQFPIGDDGADIPRGCSADRFGFAQIPAGTADTIVVQADTIGKHS